MMRYTSVDLDHDDQLLDDVVSALQNLRDYVKHETGMVNYEQRGRELDQLVDFFIAAKKLNGVRILHRIES